MEAMGQLPPAGSAFEITVSAILTRLNPIPPAPTALQDLEDIRIAAAHHLHLSPPQALLSADASGLSLVWSISLI